MTPSDAAHRQARSRGCATAPRAAASVLLLCLAPGLWAQGSVSVSSGVSLSQYWSDNSELSSANRRSEATTVLTPSVRVAARNEFVRGSLDYALNAIGSTRESGDIQHSLAASFVAEPIRRTAFVDVRAAVSQQSISAFGVQSPGGPRSNAAGNRTEVRTASVSPYLLGNIGGAIDWEARSSYTRTSTSGSTTGDGDSRFLSLRASGGRAALRWSLGYSDNETGFDGGRTTSVERLDGDLTWQPHYDWRLSARVGREKTDVLSSSGQNRPTWGLGATWTPSPRTEIAGNLDDRYYGRAFRVSLNHRTPRTAWRFGASRDASSDRQGVDVSALRAYDEAYAALAQQVPDPVLRDQIARQLLGQRPAALTSAASVLRRFDFSTFWSGVRATASLSAYRQTTRRLDPVSAAQDDLSSVARVGQSGIDVATSWRLSATARLGLAWSRQQTADAGSRAGNSLHSTSLSWSEQLWQQAALSASLRRTTFHADLNPYTENGASITFSLRF